MTRRERRLPFRATWTPAGIVGVVGVVAALAGGGRGAARVVEAQGASRAPVAPPSAGPSTNAADAAVRSPRNANYTINARLEASGAGRRTLTGTEVIVWRNITANATAELRFHTYWNAWRDPRSTFMRERALAGRQPDAAPDDFAQLTVESIKVSVPGAGDGSGGGVPVDLTSRTAFVAPDDGNADDRTVLAVPLPAPVAPGGSLRIEVAWTARVPRPFARTGGIGDFYFIAQWFPKLGVLEDGGWNCHQFHATTEFFSDYGVYDVALTVPSGWIVGATGVEYEAADDGHGTTTHRFRQDDVHDFAWTTSPDFLVETSTFTPDSAGPGARVGPPVAVRLLLRPEHRAQARRHMAAAHKALKYYSAWFGPYPYDHLTVVDPAFQSEAEGMEYPTLVTAGTSWLVPSGLTVSTPEEVTIHEIGHQWFYGVVGSNEFEDAWMDEGINTYATARVLGQEGAEAHYERRFFGGFVPAVFPDFVLRRETAWNRLPGYRAAPDRDLPSMPSYRYSVASGTTVTYNKTALWLNTLERMLGWPVMQRTLATYYTRWRFMHPKPADFFAVVNEVSGQDLTWFFDQVYRSSNVVDYAVETLKSAGADGVYRTDVIVRRNGEAIFPVDVEIAFADGSRQQLKWDGRDRWKAYGVTSPARAVSAQVDPRRVLLLDVNYTNNSRTLAPRAPAAATKWTLTWLVWLQDALLSWAYFV